MIFHCAQQCSLQARSFFSSKGGLVDPRMRASNVHLLSVRVPRAGGRPGYPSPPTRCASTENRQETLLFSPTYFMGSGQGCPRLRASDVHILIVRVLRARRAPGRSPPALWRGLQSARRNGVRWRIVLLVALVGEESTVRWFVGLWVRREGLFLLLRWFLR